MSELPGKLGTIHSNAALRRLFTLGGGVYIVFRVAMAILNILVMFRQGFLARADR